MFNMQFFSIFFFFFFLPNKLVLEAHLLITCLENVDLIKWVLCRNKMVLKGKHQRILSVLSLTFKPNLSIIFYSLLWPYNRLGLSPEWLLARSSFESTLCVCQMKSGICLCEWFYSLKVCLCCMSFTASSVCFESFFYSNLSVFISRVPGSLQFVWPDRWRQDHLQPVWGRHAGPGTKSHQRWCA